MKWGIDGAVPSAAGWEAQAELIVAGDRRRALKQECVTFEQARMLVDEWCLPGPVVVRAQVIDLATGLVAYDRQHELEESDVKQD